MTVVDDYVFTSATNHHDTASHSNTLHRRYPSVPTIKEIPNRNAFNPTYHKKHAFQSNRNTLIGEVGSIGKAPTIESTIISPTVTRKNSIIRQKKRHMISSKELKNKFFYPVNAPKRKKSRRGKFRNSFELNSSMNYINIDSSMSKDLCLNQQVKAYELPPKELIKLEPKLKETTKAITIDSKNNYIIYTPNPTAGKNSLISDPEQILDQELLKLGTPITFNKANTPILPEYEFERPYFNRYDTFPKEDPISYLHRTRSLPPKFNNKEGIEELWKLYLRRVISARIKWRLENLNKELKPGFNPRRKSASSSVDTSYFMSTLLKQNGKIPQTYKSSSSDDYFDDIESSDKDEDTDEGDDEINEPVTDEDINSINSNHDNNGNSYSPDENSAHRRTGNLSRVVYHSGDNSEYYRGSLESLLNEMRSIIE
ncbi:hypothetical protein BN7_600 [Wickerhamomyces ciferrii]|uniref:Uncharacterized protein n=1 Tax=Wickerhamomyces ciferrii (strain ATCC 14091 / BCRC 22168 / CBS 111 / JCM 3599 / NBRC 0793 / NRRL Y-1031 F-60-10) TaxID=1206466 RepID=K0KIU1_WICCF|nr:uncharacterized protein BN7_600 [Wickerhamomyces ciferrii]CCH41063.1 hypothetical protein BN7_600 [Wickerhamomyces ciferrii]